MPSHQPRPPDNASDDEEHHSLCDDEEGDEHMLAIKEGNEYILATGEGMRLFSINYVRCSMCIFKFLLSNVCDRDVGPDTISDTFRARTLLVNCKSIGTPL